MPGVHSIGFSLLDLQTSLDSALGHPALCAANRQEEFSCFSCLTFTPAGEANQHLIHVNSRRMKWSQQFKWIPGLSILFPSSPPLPPLPGFAPVSVSARVSARP